MQPGVGEGNKFVAAVEGVYDAALDPSRWPAALEAIANVFGDVGANLLWRRDDGGFGVIVSPGLSPESVKAYNETWWQHDIRASRSAERLYLTESSVLTDRHFASPDEIETHPIYTDFLARYGLKWVAGAFVSPDPRIFVSVNIQRAIGREPFDDAELALLERLSRHVEKSLRLSIRLLDAEVANVGLGEALARVGIGVFALDSLKRVVLRNPAGDRLLGDGLDMINQRLLASSPGGRRSLEQAIDDVLASTRGDVLSEIKPILIPRRGSRRPLTVYVLPVNATSNLTAQFLTHTRVIILVIDPSTNEPADPSIVRDLLGLTIGEARVAALVGSGVAPRDAAQRLGITEETARTVLKRAFAKTGVSRQSELSALLTKLVLRGGIQQTQTSTD